MDEQLRVLPSPPPLPAWLKPGSAAQPPQIVRDRMRMVEEWWRIRCLEEWKVEGIEPEEVPPAWWLLMMLVRYHGWRPGHPGQWRP